MFSLRVFYLQAYRRQDIIHWPSDYFIVSRKSVKADGEKGVAVIRRGSRETSAGQTELGDRW
jgi:hypothetical protein